MIRRTAFIAGLGGSLAILSACGSGAGNGTGGAGATGTGTGGLGGAGGDDPAMREAVVTSLEDEYMLLAPRSNPDQRQAMIAYARGLSGVVDAGWTDADHGDNFFALLADETPFAMLDNLVNAPDAVSAAAAPEGPAPKGLVIVPLSLDAHLMFSLGNAFLDNRPALQTMLKKAGYEVRNDLATLEVLHDGIGGDGYLYWATHSGWLDIDKVPTPVISTASQWSRDADATLFISTLRKNHEIAIAGASWDAVPNPVDTNGNGKIDDEERVTHKTVYAIRPAFIANHFKLSDSSVVMQDSCTSADKVFADAYFAAKAGMYVGWDKVTYLSPKMALFTDRLLGSNTVDPIESPPERPFPQENVIAWMRAKGLDGSGSGSKLEVAINAGSQAGILAPSIRFLWVDEGFFQNDPSTLTLSGEFGPRDDGKYKREVILGGKSLNVTGGDDFTIIADLPDDDAAAGPVVVIIGGRTSNEVPLSLYDVHMIWQFAGPGSLHISQNLHYKLRMDVHRSREDVGLPPVGPPQSFRSRKDSGGSFRRAAPPLWAIAPSHGRGPEPSPYPPSPLDSGSCWLES